jgi:hypothetical protein
MTYNKPEVTKLDNAVNAIQSGLFKTSIYVDSRHTSEENATASAYEADE